MLPLEGTLLERLRKIEALYAGTNVDGEREAVGAAVRWTGAEHPRGVPGNAGRRTAHCRPREWPGAVFGAERDASILEPAVCLRHMAHRDHLGGVPGRLGFQPDLAGEHLSPGHLQSVGSLRSVRRSLRDRRAAPRLVAAAMTHAA